MSTKALITAKITAEEFGLLSTAESEDYELVEGQLVPLPSSAPIYGIVRDRMGRLIWNYLDQNPVGTAVLGIDCRLASDLVRRPDISVFLGDRLREIDLRRIPIPFAPNIAVEVLSPTEGVVEVNRKVLEYLRAGCQEVWLLDQENGEIFIRSDSGIRPRSMSDILESPLLPGFSVKVATLLAGL